MDGRVVVQDIPRFLTAFSEWIAVMVVCGCFPRKNWWPGFIAKAVLFLVCQTVFLQMTANVPRVFWIPCMILAVLGMGLFLYSACLLPPVVVFYYTMVAFLTAEFTASLEWQIEFFFLGFPPGDDLFRLATELLVNLAVALTGSWLIGRGSSRFIASITWRESASVFLIAVLAFSMSNISFVTTETPFSVRFPVDVFGLRTMVDLAGLAIMFAHQSRISELVAEREAAAVNTALNAQYDQYRNYLQGIELINIKYHDLKHQIAGMRAEIDPEKRELWLNQLEEELEDSASIDGASQFQYHLRILLPLSGASLATITLFYAVDYWNAYFYSLIYITKRQMLPMQAILRQVLMTTEIETLMYDAAVQTLPSEMLKDAMIVVTALPIICLYPFIQRFFVKGVMVGSLKG